VSARARSLSLSSVAKQPLSLYVLLYVKYDVKSNREAGSSARHSYVISSLRPLGTLSSPSARGPQPHDFPHRHHYAFTSIVHTRCASTLSRTLSSLVSPPSRTGPHATPHMMCGVTSRKACHRAAPWIPPLWTLFPNKLSLSLSHTHTHTHRPARDATHTCGIISIVHISHIIQPQYLPNRPPPHSCTRGWLTGLGPPLAPPASLSRAPHPGI
jgi:hypothetical protein